jgi:tRNA(Arg) A34 adenosine deaminase TadA
MKHHIAHIATKTAQKSDYPVFRHGAVIESGGRVLAKSCNIRKTVTPVASMSVHAEIAALKRFMSKARLKEKMSVNLYVARVAPGEHLALSKPCPKCMAALKASGIVKSIFYSLNSGEWVGVEL